MNEDTVSRSKLVVANWKMHGDLATNQALLADYIAQITPIIQSSTNELNVVVCVPYPYLYQTQQLLQHTAIAWGAQNMSKDTKGAFTGEVSARMLNDFGARYVIIGHSERSTAYCESDENIATKFMQAQAHGLIPILCVGETLIEREAGVMELAVGKQLELIINQYGAAIFENAVIAYEPIWAIGTGLAASSEQAQNMHSFIREKIAKLDARAANSLKILYGGSVNPQNAIQLMHTQHIDGGLIGKCSLNANDFANICKAAA